MANPAKIVERGTDGVAFEALIPASQPGDVFPAGTVVDYAGSSAPTGWLICDGSAVSRATYPTLNSAMSAAGYPYGSGDGVTTFNIPDCRGKVIAGKHSSGTFLTLGASGGVETVTLSIANLPSHSHGGSTTSVGTTTDAQGAHGHSGSHDVQSVQFGSGSVVGGYGKAIGGSGSYNTGFSIDSVGNHSHNVSSHAHGIAAEGSGSAHSNLQPYIVLNKIIRAY